MTSIRGYPFFHRKIFRLYPNREGDAVRSGRSSDFPTLSTTFPSGTQWKLSARQWHTNAERVPFPRVTGKRRDHSGGPVPDSHGVPCSALLRAPERYLVFLLEWRIRVKAKKMNS